MFISNTYLQFYTTRNVDIREKIGEKERGSKRYFRVLGPYYYMILLQYSKQNEINLHENVNYIMYM